MRKIISLTDSQVEWIKSEAKRFGVSETEIIRRLIDRAMQQK
jgi:negative regulator of replication initiation